MASTPVSSNKRKATDETTSQRKVRRLFSEAPKTGTRMVAVHVGKGTSMKSFEVYEELLIRHSEFFRAAVSKKWREGQERAVSLPEDKPGHFEIFFNFLNGGQIFSSKEGDHDPEQNTDLEWSRLIWCWILGQKLLSVTFKDAILDAIVAKMQDQGRYSKALYMQPFDYSTPSQSLRKLLSDIVVYKWVPLDWTYNTPDIAKYPEHLLDVAMALDAVKWQGRDASPPWANNDCTYHEHVADGTPCYKTLF
ncbi:hypothetical protein LTR56_023798 [Elasticomyces elasticus]|nr:hypothetical protein LTR56_023798 [Elasticomyces elasticus]KAK3663904.1 hypothetical protein LTR22_005366 [Elasticomyces elasticus]KAK4906502.1 hypothetical protein LTR49_024347 [Elasticomyces elasticus]KAK5745406.1 hypothetical protein LTS12_023125 [Elasticomyces elasticus]